MSLTPSDLAKLDEVRVENGWHLKKEFQVGHIITSIVIAGSVLTYVNKIEQRLAIVETQLIQQRDRDERQDKITSESLAILRAQFDRIDAKLDRLLEGKK